MNKIILPIWLMPATITCRAQSIGTRTVNSTGATTSAGGLVLEWSVGEMVTVQTLVSPNVTLTQGVLQPGAFSDAPLPVTLLYFKGKAINGQALLNWATTKEINNHHFDVERSSNGIEFQIFKQVAGAGNSSIPAMYSVTDPGPYPTTYYRLKQVDINGNYRYSTIVQVQFSLILAYGLYPNPTKGHLYLSLNGDPKTVEVTVMDMNGRIVLRKIPNPTTRMQIDVNHLPNGSYFISVKSSGTVWSGKFVKH